MVFPSVPVYLNPPNWQQHPTHQQQQQGLGNESPQLPPLPPSSHGGSSGTGSSIRPGSMSERARLAKLPQPEAGLKCPRCDSTNTKFCYFNNYSLTQPRHFCKTCRRYWTKGGALRNVPVGGGCRRNKKSKSQNNSKSPVSSENRQMGNTSSSISALPSDMIGHLPQQPGQLPFMTSLHNLTSQFGVGNIGLNFGGSGQTSDMGFQLGSNNSGMSGTNGILSGGGQHFPLFESPAAAATSLYPFQGDQGVESPTSMVGDSSLHPRSMTPSSRVSQLAPVKMEDNNHNQGLNLSRSTFLGTSDQNNQYWGGNTWTDLSGLNSTSSSHLL